MRIYPSFERNELYKLNAKGSIWLPLRFLFFVQIFQVFNALFATETV